MRFLPLLLLLPAAAAFSDSKPVTSNPVPFRLEAGMVIVPVRINGEGPFRMIVDTGANVTVLEDDAAARLGLKLGKKKTVKEAYGDGEEALVLRDAELKQVELGSVVSKEVTAVVTDLSRFSEKDSACDGILGYAEILHNRVLKIDYPRQELELVERSLPEVPRARRTVIPFRFRDGFLERLVGIHAGPKLDIQVNGKKACAQLDTGFNGAFAVMPAAVERLGLTEARDRGEVRKALGARGAVEYRTGQVEAIAFGDVVVEKPRVSFFSANSVGGGSRKYDLNVGNGFLKSYCVTFDFRKKQVILERPSED